MPISNDYVVAALRTYLDVHPGEADALAPLLALAREQSPVTARATLSGHVTCGAVGIAPDGRVVQIHHRTLNTWLLPGGHVEPTDTSLLAAAVREFSEETGMSPHSLRPIQTIPIDIDAHTVPENPAKNEPGHTHYDFRFAFSLSAGLIQLQLAEVTSFRWTSAGDLNGRLRTRVPASGVAP
ncbi:NUDIX hydrolase [Frankia sp. Cas4]|uniref:NUDIX hydrolase n=1 Tax=Frankia sp. Cas4 TaxID=3073927 RepID=UPI002AD1E303|nr:NUDIX hydrolase [Frankia sp. Cas4]